MIKVQYLIWLFVRFFAGKGLIYGLLLLTATTIFAEGIADFKFPGRQISIDIVRKTITGEEKRLNLQNVPYLVRNDVISVLMDGDSEGWVCAIAFLPTDDSAIKDKHIVEGFRGSDGIFKFTAPDFGNIGLVPVVMLAKKKNNWLKDFREAVKKKHTEFRQSAADFQRFGQATTFIEQAADYMASLGNSQDANEQLTTILNAFAKEDKKAEVEVCYGKATRQERRSCIFPLLIDSLLKPKDSSLGNTQPIFQILANLIPSQYLLAVQGGVALARFITRLFDKGYQFRSAVGIPIFDANNKPRIQLNLKEAPVNDINKKPTVQVYVLPSAYGSSNEIPRSQLINNNTIFCSNELESKMTILPTDAAKLLAGKELAHDWALRLDGGSPIPLELNAEGKFTIKRDENNIPLFDPQTLPKNAIYNATISGSWGFAEFDVSGKFKIITRRDASAFEILNNNAAGFLELGKSETITLRLKDGSELPLCLDTTSASITNSAGFPKKSATSLTVLSDQSIQLTFDLNVNNFNVSPGSAFLLIKPQGGNEILKIPTPKFGRPKPNLTAADYRKGDNFVVIKGTGLEGVDSIRLKRSDKTAEFLPVEGSLKLVGTAEERRYSTTESVEHLNTDKFTSEVTLSEERGIIVGPSDFVKGTRPAIKMPEFEITEQADNTITLEEGEVRMADKISLTLTMADNSPFPFSADSNLQIRKNQADVPALIKFAAPEKAEIDIQSDSKSATITFRFDDIVLAQHALGRFEFSIKQGELESNWMSFKDNPLFIRVPWNLKISCPVAPETRYTLLSDGFASIRTVSLVPREGLNPKRQDKAVGGKSFLISLPPAPPPVEGQPETERTFKFLLKLGNQKTYPIDLKIPVCSP